MGRRLIWLHPALAGLAPALVGAGAIWAAGSTAVGLAGAGAGAALAGAGSYRFLARSKRDETARAGEARR